MTNRGDRALTWLGIAASGLAFSAALGDITRQAWSGLPYQGAAMALIVLSLLYGSFVFLITRIGALQRAGAHLPRSIEELREDYAADAPPVCVLIPSYKEESRVVLQTVLSAALAEYSNRRIVVLLDDPPESPSADHTSLAWTRRMLAGLHDEFAELAEWLSAEREAFLLRNSSEWFELQEEADRLAGLHEHCARWIDRLGAPFRSESGAFAHTDRLFLEKVLGERMRDYLRTATELRAVPATNDRLRCEYARLAQLFAVEISTFERKRYANLSHQPNKAMNLNSYIGLLGGSYRAETAEHGATLLLPCGDADAELRVPNPTYVLTLDADSLILNDYILRLVDAMERDQRLAVAQTPYSACPGAPSSVERTAGATTDIQYFVHQGFTAFGATFWVGANALLRLSALRQIQTSMAELGHTVPVFIQDRTVIEDTGSTIDLIGRGWRLLNYPERLAYSATPPDFGSLVIQRRRWANGGLIILPDLMRLLANSGEQRVRAGEFLVRAHYLCSPLLGNIGLIALLFIPFDPVLVSPFLPIAALPYYGLYARDLTRIGYHLPDLARVYALNLLLVPVNLAGVARSVEQMLTGRKSTFGRTPKVDGRTSMAKLHVLLQLGLLLVSWVSFVNNLVSERYAYAAFALMNSAFLVYGFTAMIGWREAMEDLGLRSGVTGPRLEREIGLSTTLAGSSELVLHAATARELA